MPSNTRNDPATATSPHVYQLDADVVLYALPDLVPMTFKRGTHVRYLGHEPTGHRFFRWCHTKGVWDEEIVFETPVFPKVKDKNGVKDTSRNDFPSLLPRPKVIFLGPLPFLVPPGLEALFGVDEKSQAPREPTPVKELPATVEPEPTPDDVDVMLTHLRAAHTNLQTARARAICPKCVEKIKDVEGAAGYLLDDLEKAAKAYRALDEAKVTGRWEDLPDDVKRMVKEQIKEG